MKKFNYILLLILFGFAMSSCNKDDDDNNQNNFTFDGKEYDASQGFFEALGENEDGSFDIDVYLISESIEIDFEKEEFRGSGQILYLDLNSSEEKRLVSGKYLYDTDRKAFTFVSADALLNGSAAMEFEDGEDIEFDGGEIEIIAGNTETEIIYDLTSTSTGKSLKGSYKGVLREVF